MKLEYKIEPMIYHLKHIKKMCLENVDCTGCPFQLKNNWAEYCMFGGPHWDDGVIPEDWDLEELVKNGKSCYTCKYKDVFSLNCARCDDECSQYEPINRTGVDE